MHRAIVRVMEDLKAQEVRHRHRRACGGGPGFGSNQRWV
jgi:hypothetical protein